MKDSEQRKAAKIFAANWKNKGSEKGQSQPFWLSLLHDVYGIEHPEQFIIFEDKVVLDNTAFIDGHIPSTHVLIEQKSIDKDLTKPIKQSDGSLLTPFQQAKRYSSELPYSQRPRWIVTCNFKEFYVYDMENPNSDPETIKLENIEKDYYRLQFLVDEGNKHLKEEMEVSIQAGDIVGLIYEALHNQYIDSTSEESLKSLNILCVRLVFCLYAEDSGIFGKHAMFHDYLERFEIRDLRRALIDLFKILDTKEEDRDPYLDSTLASFPYVNGGLFADENIEIPQFTEKIKDLLINKASSNFNWSKISPTIFGAVFESTLNPETRRNGGMHYTSIENIHKVINPLFLDDLKDEFHNIKETSILKTKEIKLKDFQKKLASITCFDPACGSGNFLTESYLSLRRLENEVLKELHKGQIVLNAFNPIKVSISQFHGIEINDFAVTVAKTALWIAESQMMKETETIVNMYLNFLPLKTNANIVEGNALRINWENVVPKYELDYIIGNPPFLGARFMNYSQKEDINNVFGEKWKKKGDLDYVSCWFKKSADFMINTNIKAALVSTNSITQGDAVGILWKKLFEDGVVFNFAHRTFRWDNEANINAHVHCVIIGFSKGYSQKEKIIYDSSKTIITNNINAYLINAPNIFVVNRTNTICNVTKMDFGSMPNDGGFLSNYTKDDRDAIISKYPEATKFFKKIVGAKEFINNKERYCLWLKGVAPNEYKKITPIYQAVNNVKKLREASTREATKKLSNTPMLFGEIRQPETDYLLVPSTSSERRRYIPIGFMPSDIISSNANLVIADATTYMFGILTSNVHMAWMRAVAGRLKSDYRYSAKIVYNNFPWPNSSEIQIKKIEKTAQSILDARKLYPDSSLADLYDELIMPPELRKAHQQNDKAVMEAYNFNWRTMTETDCIAELMKIYEKLKVLNK